MIEKNYNLQVTLDVSPCQSPHLHFWKDVIWSGTFELRKKYDHKLEKIIYKKYLKLHKI